jgi:hypothetical protein
MVQNSAEATSQIDSGCVRRVCVPRVLRDELEAAGLRGLAKYVVYWIIYRSLTTKARSCAIHQGLLDDTIGSTARKQVMQFIRDSTQIQRASNGLYRPGRQCIRYELTHSLTTGESHQHKSVVEMGRKWVGRAEGDTVWVTVDFSGLMEAIVKGFAKRGWDKSIRNAEWSLCRVDEPKLTEPEVVAQVGDGQKAEHHAAAFARYRDKPLNGITRKDGRLYSTVTSLPRWIREREVTFNGESESVDISCCYLWLLAAEHRLSRVRRGLCTREVDALMEMIERGDFYRRIAEMAEIDTATAKADFNTFCLFGPIGFHKLWYSLESICRGVCRDIRWWRSQPGGATRLAHFLQRAEGQLMLDGVIDWFVSGGVPCVGIHDGCIVPAGGAGLAEKWIQGRSREIYGRSCRVKVVTFTGAKS